MYHDLQDGKKLILLLEILSGEKLVCRLLNPFCYFSCIQWNLDFTIWQGNSKIILLNRDIVVNELPIYKNYCCRNTELIIKSGISLDRGHKIGVPLQLGLSVGILVFLR